MPTELRALALEQGVFRPFCASGQGSGKSARNTVRTRRTTATGRGSEYLAKVEYRACYAAGFFP